MNRFAGYFCCYWCCYGYYCWYDYYCGLTLSFIFCYECLRGWLDYPGHSFFLRPLVASLEFSGGLSRHNSCGYPIGISLQVLPWCHLTSDRHFFSRPLRGVPRVLRRFITPLLLWIPDWHFFSSPTVASLDTRLAFLFKSSSWRPSNSQAVCHATTLVDTRLAFLFKTYRGVTWHPTGIYFILFSFNFPCLSLTFLYIHLFAHANMLSCHDLIPVSVHLI
jgi:hypothetical protein